MTPEQYDRWQDFAVRMARTCFAASRRPSQQWIIDAVDDFFDRVDETGVPKITDWDSGPVYVCDDVSGYTDDLARYPPQCWACRHPQAECECRCDKIKELFWRQWDEQWASPISCCIRAGLDMASAPSGGAIGFTAGDLRKMYPEGVPEWCFPPDEQLHYWPHGELNGTFAELPDHAGVVL